MNTKLEAAMMISAGALLAAGAQYAPQFGPSLLSHVTGPAEAVVPVDDTASGFFGVRVIPCQDAVITQRNTTNATINTRDDRGGFTVSIKDGELTKIEAQGEYALEEEGDTVRILDPNGGVAFETSRSNPSIGDSGFMFRSFEAPIWNLAAPPAPAPRAALGVGSSPVDPALAAQLGIEAGVVIGFVEPGSGADAAGLRQFDVLTTIDDEALDQVMLSQQIAAHEPGDTVAIGLIRGGKAMTIDVTLGSAPGVSAPAFDQIDALRRMLGEQRRLTDTIKAAPFTPRPMLTPRSAPAQQPDPNTTDASEMAPRTNARPVPA